MFYDDFVYVLHVTPACSGLTVVCVSVCVSVCVCIKPEFSPPFSSSHLHLSGSTLPPSDLMREISSLILSSGFSPEACG